MSSLKSLLKTLSVRYKDFPDSDTTCLMINEIYKEIENEKCAKNKSIAVVTVFSIICSKLDSINNINYNSSLKYIQLFLPFLGYDYLINGLQYITFFIHYSFTQNKIAEIRKFLIDFKFQPGEKEDLLRIYVDIHKTYCKRIFNYQPEEREVKSFFGNLTIIFQITENMNAAKFLEYSEEMLGKSREYIKTIISHHTYSQDFLKTYLNILSTLQNISNLNSFCVHLTKIFIYFLEIETTMTKKQSTPHITKSFLTAITSNAEIKKNKYITDVLSIYYNLIKLLDSNDNDEQQIKFNKVLKEYKIFLERNEISEIWFMDSIVTFIEQLNQISPYIAKNTNKDNCELVFDILEKLLEYVYEIKYWKKMCPECDNYKLHQIYNIYSSGIQFYHRVITLNFINEYIDKFILNIIRISLECKEKYNCKISNHILLTLVADSCGYMKDIKSGKRIKYGIVMLDFMAHSELKKFNILNILRLYRQYYEIRKDKKKLLIIQALYILNLTVAEKYYHYVNYEMPIFIDYLLETNTELDTLISDIIPDSESHLKPTVSNINYILQHQIEIVAQRKLLNGKQLENLVIKHIGRLNSNLQFGLFARNLNIITDKILLNKINNIITNITDNLNKSTDNSDTFENHYVLGILYKREAMQLFEQLRVFTKINALNKDDLKEFANMQYDAFNCKIENTAINVSILSIKHFACILPHLNNEKYSKLINWINLFDDISILARQFELRGYLNHGYIAWKLLYDISTNYHNCNLQQMRAISYFCKHYVIINILNEDLNLKNIINSLSKQILEKFENIDLLTPRRQNYVLLCILDIGYYYAEQNDIKSCNALMNMVLNKINNIESKKNIFELVRAKLCALEFHLVTKFEIKLKYSPYCFIQSVLKEIKNIQYITSEDSINIVNFLFDFIQEVVYFFMSVNDVKNMIIFVMHISKYAFDAGLIFRITQIILLWAQINLEQEEYEDCQIKLVIVNKLMLIETDLNIEYSQNKSDEILNITSNNNLLTVKQTRDPSNFPISPGKLKPAMSSNKYSLFKYLNNHPTKCACEFCKHPIYKMIQFQMGCLYARMYYLNGKTVIAEEFFERSLNWCNKNSSDYFNLIFNNFKMWMLIYYINSLRSNRKYNKANEICKLAIHFIESSPIKFDLGCSWKIIEQKEAINYILNKIKAKNITPTKNKMKPNSKELILNSPLVNVGSIDKQFLNENSIICLDDLEAEVSTMSIKKSYSTKHTENESKDLKKGKTFEVTKKNNRLQPVLKELKLASPLDTVASKNKDIHSSENGSEHLKNLKIVEVSKKESRVKPISKKLMVNTKLDTVFSKTKDIHSLNDNTIICLDDLEAKENVPSIKNTYSAKYTENGSEHLKNLKIVEVSKKESRVKSISKELMVNNNLDTVASNTKDIQFLNDNTIICLDDFEIDENVPFIKNSYSTKYSEHSSKDLKNLNTGICTRKQNRLRALLDKNENTTSSSTLNKKNRIVKTGKQ